MAGTGIAPPVPRVVELAQEAVLPFHSFLLARLRRRTRLIEIPQRPLYWRTTPYWKGLEGFKPSRPGT